jgi:hypothetical protein
MKFIYIILLPTALFILFFIGLAYLVGFYRYRRYKHDIELIEFCIKYCAITEGNYKVIITLFNKIEKHNTDQERTVIEWHKFEEKYINFSEEKEKIPIFEPTSN